MGALHVVLKYNDSIYDVNTLDEHISIIEKFGKVIWGILKQKPDASSPGMARDKIEQIKKQIGEGIKTYAFMAKNGEIKAKGEIIDILVGEDIEKNKEIIPSYYRNDINKCVVGVVLRSLEKLNDRNIKDLLKRYGTDDDITLNNRSTILYVEFKNDNNDEYVNDSIGNSSDDVKISDDIKIDECISHIENYIKSNGYYYEDKLIKNFYLSLKTKPFVILAGISGTGKSKLVKLFAEAVGSNTDNGRFLLVPVRPDWSDSTDLLGYRDLQGRFHPGILTTFVYRALNDRKHPYFFCLDEMNLARVEYYFSDVLSIMETRRWRNGEIVTDKLLKDELFGNDETARDKYKNLYLPDNLYIIGTVNMDETTFSFSKKVLDRANTIEFSKVDLEPWFGDYEDEINVNQNQLSNDFLKSEYITLNKCIEYKDLINKTVFILKEINNILYLANLHFGYRIRDEICYYIIYNENLNLISFEEAIDFQIMQKILPRIQGSSFILKKVLMDLFKICIGNQSENFSEGRLSEDMFEYLKNNDNISYKRSAQKIAFMVRRFEEDGFTSYWL